MKNVIITGAAGGIGQALCDAFHDDGWHVIGTGRKKPSGSIAEFFEMDLDTLASDEACRSDSISRLRAQVPDGKLHALINNSAVQILAPTDEIKLPDWEQSFRVNLTAPMLLTQAFLPELEAARGCVLNIGSIHAKLTKPGFVTYATTKAALNGLTRAMAVDLGGRVRVNAIEPAAIRTPMLEAGFTNDSAGFLQLKSFHPSGDIGLPAEVARLALNICGSTIPFLTGSVIAVDGGIGARLHDPA